MSVPTPRVLAVAVAALAVLAAAASPATAFADASAATGAAAPAGAQPCAPADLLLRQAAPAAAATPSPDAPVPDAIYVLKNRGAVACTISGGVGVRLFDPNGDAIALRVAPRNAMPLLLTLAPGDEASFTVSFAPHGTARCATSARIEVYLAPQLAPLAAATSLQACSGATMTVSNLRFGLPPGTARTVSPIDSARFT